MKKVLILFTLVLSLFALTACSGTEVADLEAELATAEAALAAAEGDITALEADVAAAEAALAATVLPTIPTTLVLADANFDDFLGRPDVQYVDLRNFDDKMNSGYVAGFEFIPFFDYLEHENVLVRTNLWTFEAAGIMNQAQLENLFDKDAEAIFLMCGSGTRAGFVKDALESIGYDNVINVMGLGSYTGDHKVLGDSTFVLDHPASGMYTPGTYFAVDPTTQYTTTIVVGEGGAIVDVVFDAMYHGTTKNTLDTGYTLGSGITWKTEAAELAAYVLANQGWGEIILDVTDISGLDYYTVPHHFIEIDHTGAVDAVAGVSIGVEGFVLSWNLAIAQAGGTAIAGVPTSQEWTDAHNSPYDLIDGVYFGDSDGGYTAMVTIMDSMIVDVYFDAVRVVATINNNGTPADDTDDFIEYSTFSTKQALGEAYMLASGFTWAAEADELAAAIVDNGEWNPDWVIIPGATSADHDKFDMTDTATADAVGGVTIGIEGFVDAFEEALAKAVPTPQWVVYNALTLAIDEDSALITYDAHGASWDNNAQLELVLDGTETSIDLTVIGTLGHNFKLKIEGGGVSTEVDFVGTGVSQVVTLDFSQFTEAEIQGLNLFVLFPTYMAGDAGSIDIFGWEYTPTT